jgi:predicted ATPase
MIERLSVKNFRMLAGNQVDLGRFAVLVGRNASGKSTLMAALRFVSHVLSDGVDKAVESALDGGGSSFDDLCFRAGQPIQIAVEMRLGDAYRFELEVGVLAGSAVPVVLRENLYRLPPRALLSGTRRQASLFGEVELDGVIHAKAKPGWRKIVSKSADGKDYFQDERTEWNTTLRFGANKSALGNLPEDPQRLPGGISVRNFLRDGVVLVELDSHMLRMPSRPLSTPHLRRDGANLAAAARALKQRDEVLFEQWVKHVGDAVGGLTAVSTWERPEDKHVVLQGHFDGSHSAPVPSWLLSDGTLRLMALSLLSYAEPEEQRGIVLVEEPENGLHPLAIQSVHQALSTMRTTQVFVATHSPVFLASTEMEQALVFRRAADGVAEVCRGDEVAALRNWKNDVRLANVFASGVLA